RTPQSRHQAAVESTAAELQSFTVPGGWQVYFEIDVGRRVGSRMNCAKHLAEAAILVVGGIGGDKLRGPDRCPARGQADGVRGNAHVRELRAGLRGRQCRRGVTRLARRLALTGGER